MIIITSFRGLSVGTDTYQYDLNFKYISKNSFDFANSPYSAPFYYVLNVLLGNISDNGISLRIFQACITYYCVYKLICKNTVNQFLALYLFVGWGLFACAMNISRQMMGISLALYATYLFMIDKRKIVAVILWGIAILTHISSIVAVIIPFLMLFFRYNKNLLWWTILSVFIAIITNLLCKYSLMIVSTYFEHYKAYTTEGQRWNIFAQKTTGNFFYFYLFFLSLVMCLVFKVKKYYYSSNVFACLVIPFLIISMIIGILNPFNEIIYRFLIPSFVLFFIVLIPYLFELMNFREKRIFLPVILLLTCIYFMYSLIIKNSGEIVPYTLIQF